MEKPAKEKRRKWPITEKFVDQHKKADGKDHLYFDEHDKGFGVRVNQNGVVTFFLNYVYGNRERRATLGEPSRRRWPEFKVWEAVAAARKMRSDLSGDQRTEPVDPLALRKAKRNMKTISDLADYYLHEHAEVYRRANYVRSMRNILNAVIRPRFGHLSITALSDADVQRMQSSFKGTPYYGNRCLGILSAMMNKAIEKGWATENPCDGVQRFDEREREKWLTDTELQRLATALDFYEDQAVASAIRLILFTGARHSEVAGARWDQFDLEHNPPRWNLPGHATKQNKPHHVRLSKHALAAIGSITRRESPFLFPGNCNGHRQSLRTAWRDIRKAAGLPSDLHIHDLRHNFASMLISDGVPLNTVGKMLGHTRPETTMRYAHLIPEALQDATQRSDDLFARKMATKTVQ